MSRDSWAVQGTNELNTQTQELKHSQLLVNFGSMHRTMGKSRMMFQTLTPNPSPKGRREHDCEEIPYPLPLGEDGYAEDGRPGEGLIK